MGIPVAIKTHKWSVYEKYSCLAVKKLQNASFKKNEFAGESNVKELSSMLFNDEEISKLINKDTSLNRTEFNLYSLFGKQSNDLTEDELKDLADAMNEMTMGLRNRVISLKESVAEIHEKLESAKNSKAIIPAFLPNSGVEPWAANPVNVIPTTSSFVRMLASG